MALKFAVNNSLSAVTSLPTAIPTGSMTLLQTQTASSSSTIDFTSNIDSTYDVYCFKFINILPATNNVRWVCNFRDGGSSFDATKTTTFFQAYHDESDTFTSLAYNTGVDLAQSTSDLRFTGDGQGNGADESLCGEMYIYNPSSTTFVKHFMAKIQYYDAADYSINNFVAGYCNVTTAIDGVQFKYSSGNISSGDIKLYGIS